MSSPHRPVNPRSGLVLDTHELGRRAGAMKVVRAIRRCTCGPGNRVIGVPPGSPVELDLRLESVVEGVLVTGRPRSRSVGNACGASVRSLDSSRSISRSCSSIRASNPTMTSLAGCRATSSTSSHCCATRWCSICHSNPCAGITALGLCLECGANLNENPDHRHEAASRPSMGSAPRS